MNSFELEPRPQRLSDRELQIVLLAAEGLRDKEIVKELRISQSTLRTYWDRLKHKLQASTRTQAIARSLARQNRAALEDLRLAELRASLMIESLEDIAIFFMDTHGKILTWNIGVARVLGYGENDFIGRPIQDLFTEGDLAVGTVELEITRAAELGKYVDQRWHKRQDGALIWVNGILVAIKSEAGEIQFYAKIMQDDTRCKGYEEEVERLRTILEEVQKA
jgi:PAS domain S-box-containing protein